MRLLLAGPASRAALVERAATVAGAVALARDLANTPSMIKSPEWLAAEAAAVAAEHGLSSRVWREAELVAGRFRRDPRRGVGVRPPAAADRTQLSAPAVPASQHQTSRSWLTGTSC